jgi:hypothetical protein
MGDIKVKAHAPVLGLADGEITTVADTPFIRHVIETGRLEEVDATDDEVTGQLTVNQAVMEAEREAAGAPAAGSGGGSAAAPAGGQKKQRRAAGGGSAADTAGKDAESGG